MAPTSDLREMNDVIAAVMSYACQHNLKDVIIELSGDCDFNMVNQLALQRFKIVETREVLPRRRTEEAVNQFISSLAIIEREMKQSTAQGIVRTALYHFKLYCVNKIALDCDPLDPTTLINLRNSIMDYFPLTVHSSIADNVQINIDTRKVLLETAKSMATFTKYYKTEAKCRSQRHMFKALSYMESFYPMLDEYISSKFGESEFFGVDVEGSSFWEEFNTLRGIEATLTNKDHLYEFAIFLAGKHMRSTLHNFEIIASQTVKDLDQVTGYTILEDIDPRVLAGDDLRDSSSVRMNPESRRPRHNTININNPDCNIRFAYL